jgi:hypothetical protein
MFETQLTIRPLADLYDACLEALENMKTLTLSDRDHRVRNIKAKSGSVSCEVQYNYNRDAVLDPIEDEFLHKLSMQMHKIKHQNGCLEENDLGENRLENEIR